MPSSVRTPDAVATTSRDRQRAETREALFAAALEEFFSVGVAEARPERIAASVGVARSTFYFHFPTKDLVVFELLDRAEAMAAEQIDLEGASLADACAAVFASMRASLVAIRGELRREIFSTQLRRPPPARVAPLHEKLARAVERAQRTREVRRDLNASDVARTLLTGAFGALALAADDDAASAALDLSLEMALRGVLAPNRRARGTRRRARGGSRNG